MSRNINPEQMRVIGKCLERNFFFMSVTEYLLWRVFAPTNRMISIRRRTDIPVRMSVNDPSIKLSAAAIRERTPRGGR